MQNVYETLLWYSGTNGTEVVPWLAQNYTISADGTAAYFTLRKGISFQDGEPLNATAVYFSLNRLLIEDASTPVGHGSEASWLLQQLVNTSLSSALSAPQTYSQAWAQQVLAEDFVQVTGEYTFTLHIQNPNAALPLLLANMWAAILEPNFVIQHDVALWNQSSTGYNLPYPDVSASNETVLINHYFYDEVATCNAGVTPKGCATTYLDGSYDGSTAGTGPYSIVSMGQSTNDVVLKANPNYWGGANQFMGGAKIVPQINTININYVPGLSTRELDLRSASKAGTALSIDVPGTNLYDVADRNAWLNNNTLLSTITGVNLYGPYTSYATFFIPFDTNVTNAYTGTYNSFQPFADKRIRLAFADAVNVSEVNRDVYNGLGQPANNLVPPGLPPQGAYNASIKPLYSYNLTAAQDLLLSAMENPIAHFTYPNGTVAGPGVFNNTFGCSANALQANGGSCKSPVPQTITLNYDSGDTFQYKGIMFQIASAINNISTTYNMGLSVNVVPEPLGQVFTLELSGETYMAVGGWYDDYPWVVDFLGPMLAPGQLYFSVDHWNLTEMANLYGQAVTANSKENVSGLIAVNSAMNTLANQEVMHLWTIYPRYYFVMTSTVHGFYYNPSLDMQPGYYFATMY